MDIKPENIELRKKILAGIKKAVDKLILESASRNDSLVMSYEHGKVKIVPAKDLLAPEKK